MMIICFGVILDELDLKFFQPCFCFDFWTRLRFLGFGYGRVTEISCFGSFVIELLSRSLLL